jgi:hypothetical protein
MITVMDRSCKMDFNHFGRELRNRFDRLPKFLEIWKSKEISTQGIAEKGSR